MEPFISNDTYACPDCASEVKVGARGCPVCGPFRPMDWNDLEDDGVHFQPKAPFHSATTYTDARDVLEKSRRPVFDLPPVLEEKRDFPRMFLVILIVLTLLSGIAAVMKLLL